MDARTTIYCEMNFLEKFIQSLSGQDLLSFFDSGDYHLQKLFDLLFNNSIVHLNLSNEEILNSTNPYIKKLLRQQSIKSQNLPIQANDKIAPTTLFLTDEQDFEVEKTSDSSGFWRNNFENKAKLAALFVEKSYNFNRSNSFKNFDFLHKHHRHSHNAMIITDDYIFKNAHNVEELGQNLRKLLSKLLPKKLESEFHLSIITANKTFDDDVLRNAIESIFESYPFDFQLEILGYNFHKRILLTNYYYLNSDKGFSLNRGTTAKNDFQVATTFNSRAICEAYSARIIELSQLFPESKNRLLSY